MIWRISSAFGEFGASIGQFHRMLRQVGPDRPGYAAAGFFAVKTLQM